MAVLVASVILVSAALGMLPGDGTWLSRTTALVTTAVTFQFTYSSLAHEDVLVATADAALLSLAIVAATAALLLLIGVPLGVLSARRPDSRLVQSVRRVTGTLSSLPVLFWSTLIFVAFARSIGISLHGGINTLSALVAAVVALLLGDRVLVDMVQRVALCTQEILAEPYMRTVRADALGFRRHLLQSLVPPVADTIASRSMFLIGGAIVAERVFEINGLGFMVIKALLQPDDEHQLILAASMALVCIGILLRVVSRTASQLADPRRGS